MKHKGECQWNASQLKHMRNLSTIEEVYAYAQSLGIAIDESEASQFISEINEDELTQINGGFGRYERNKFSR